ncbi:GyrI-like domain-containing protein [Sutcliffiella rhizosphaerae]|uniref:AraC effector-binding domain-containing protein n=1 Tax=Sutcliffiella rhizosphaerae TaxID=2880967 RepID=A0ABM8YRC1_9BACI|nr:GyrI-like domain-containing protein [Sutcliffiella rhizosphaerae]CAG9622557.1 hypothetical protein BACCIP111883_03348 [Sutcliffiella rhizosphaerae]
MKTKPYEIVKRSSYRAIGLKWEGPWSEIGQLKQTIQKMSERTDELQHVINPTLQLGLSYHTRPDGFAHYSMFEVTNEQEIPVGMMELYIPEFTYFVTNHQKGEDIGETYYKISRWIMDSEYMTYRETQVRYFEDILPIKHEKYPLDRDLQDPHFEIWIPITQK